MPEPTAVRTSLLVLTMLIAPAVQAAGAPSGLEEVVVASRVPVAQKYLATSVAVLEADAIVARGSNSLVEVLRMLPATQVSSNGGAGQVSSLRIRGEQGYRTLTLLDGIRLSDPSGTQIGTQVEHLMSKGIARVELLRGPQGLGYGADAGGVLSLSSASPRPGWQLGLEGQEGGYGSQLLNLNLGAANQHADMVINVADFSTDGFNSLATDQTLADRDGYANTTWHGKGSVKLNDNWQVQVVHRATSALTQYDNCYSFQPTHDCRSDYDLQASRVALQYEGATHTQVFSYALTDTHRDYFADDEFSFAATGKLERLEYQGSTSGLPLADLVYGADLEQALNNGAGRYNRGTYLELMSKPEHDYWVSLGLRHDANDDFGSNTSYRLSAAWLQDLGGSSLLKWQASAGTGLRAPSPYEIAYNAGPFAYPPAAGTVLQQERSQGWEVGARWYWQDDLELGLTYFDQLVEDAIDFDLSGFSGYVQTLGTSSSKGLEFSGSAQLSSALALEFNYTRNDTRRPNGLPLRYRPRHMGNVGLRWSPQTALQLNGYVRYSEAGFDEFAQDNPLLSSVLLLDMNASYALNTRFQIYGRLENALDSRYQEIDTYNTAGRTAYVGFRVAINAN